MKKAWRNDAVGVRREWKNRRINERGKIGKEDRLEKEE